MSNEQEHTAAIAALNESEVNGRTIYVSESLPKDKVAGNKKTYVESKRSKFRTTLLNCILCPISDTISSTIQGALLLELRSTWATSTSTPPWRK